MYRLTHDFNQFNSVLTQYFDVLKNNSESYFEGQLNRGEIVKAPVSDGTMLGKAIKYYEDYLHYLYINNPDTFTQNLNSFINNLKTISCLPDGQRGLFGATYRGSKLILINPNLKDSSTLTAEERTKLYMAHELGHIINGTWVKQADEYIEECRKDGLITGEDALLIKEGVALLDEATTQERAEEFAYYISGKTRPRFSDRKKSSLFDGDTYKTNFDFYGELQAPSAMFARTLRGLGKITNNYELLKAFSKRSLNGNFFTKIFEEYRRDGQTANLFKELKEMGIIKKASYATFGMDDKKYLPKTKKSLETLRTTAIKLRDTREPFDD